MIKKSTSRGKGFVISGILFLLTLFLSYSNLPLIDSPGLMPNYFIALFVSLIAFRLMNIYILFLLGLIVDILVGSLLGQYSLTFVTIFFTNYILNKYFLLKTSVMIVSQHLILTTTGLIVFLLSSLSYELNLDVNLFSIKLVITCLICLLYQRIIQFLDEKI